MTDSSTQLKDKSGNILYVDSSAKTVATLKDYASYSKFYTLPQYTGWQTIDGKVYYYTSDHVKVTGNQVIGGVQYTFAADGSLSQSSGSRGIDVSKYQGNIDWGAVASSGISFAIIRAGYRGASTGALIEDPYFKKNIAGATKAGIKVGVYFFTQAISEAEAIEEASMVLSLVSGYKVTYPIFIDSENASGGRANGLDSGTRTAVVKAFCQTIANGGYKAGVYASKSWFGSKLNASALSNYCIWVAQYNTSCTYSGKYNLWQYTSQGTVSGISGNVDMNISYLGY
jgi:GH25 family lysozyme M1 (1,4-beta-N-acetylmuramidase)